MTQASGNRVSIRYQKEDTMGTSPASPALKILRTVGRGINLEKEVLGSQEVRSDRQVADERHGFRRVSGSIGTEWSLGSLDDMIEGLLGGSWETATLGAAVVISVTASSKTFTLASGTWDAGGFEVGDWVTTAGFTNAGNNGTHLVTSISGTDMVVTTSNTLVDETPGAAGPTLTLEGRRMKVGTTLNTYTFERAFEDVAQFQLFNGVTINGMALSIEPGSIVGATLSLLGMTSGAMTETSFDSTPTAAPTASPFNAFDGALYEGGSLLAVVTGIQVNLENNRSLSPVIGSTTSPAVYEGTIQVTGNMTVIFENATLFNKFVNETESELYIKLDDPDGTNFVAITIPRVKYNGAEIDPPQEGPVPISMPFRGLVDSTSGTSISIQVSNES
jgi:hypothetical protein